MMMQTDVAVFYASHDGQTRRIALHLAGCLIQSDHVVSLCDLGAQRLDRDDLQEASMVVLLAPIRFGSHLKPVERFVRDNKALLNGKRLAVVSINLTARKSGKDTPEANPYFLKWMKRNKLKPEIQAVFAGKLHYALYKWWEKKVIQMIMLITGGPTHLDAVVDYTRWDLVDELALRIGAAVAENKEMAA